MSDYVQTIEKTSKHVKLTLAIASLMWWGGWVFFWFSSGTARGLAEVIIVLSIPLWIYGRALKWWHHE